MEAVIALVGRPNVGKSTLFNYLTRSRDALVADYPGLTRDRKYGRGVVGPAPYVVIDTGGLTDDPEGVDHELYAQVDKALEEADAILFLVDGRNGMTAADESIANRLRRIGKPVQIVLNKTEGLDRDQVASEFYSLGLGQPFGIAAAHGAGVPRLMDKTFEELGEEYLQIDEIDEEEAGIKIAILGRPNVGKSTLVNRIVGEERVVAFDMPGTTRDSIFVPFERDGQQYTLIDTAGIRRRSKVKEAIEKFSVIKALKAIEQAHVVILVLDAHADIADQDATILGHILDSGRGLVLAINKWDGLSPDEREKIKYEMERRFPYLDFAEKHFISALHGTNVGHLYESVQTAYKSAFIDMGTSALTRILEAAVETHQPPLVRGRRVKLRYAHQGGSNPPVIVVHGNQTKSLPDSYKKFLANFFAEALKVKGSPIRVEFKTGENPFEGKRDKLTPRQRYNENRVKKMRARKKIDK